MSTPEERRDSIISDLNAMERLLDCWAKTEDKDEEVYLAAGQTVAARVLAELAVGPGENAAAARAEVLAGGFSPSCEKHVLDQSDQEVVGNLLLCSRGGGPAAAILALLVLLGKIGMYCNAEVDMYMAEGGKRPQKSMPVLLLAMGSGAGKSCMHDLLWDILELDSNAGPAPAANCSAEQRISYVLHRICVHYKSIGSGSAQGIRDTWEKSMYKPKTLGRKEMSVIMTAEGQQVLEMLCND